MNITLHNITKRFPGVLASDSISVTFPGGRIVGVLGENGAGKSTLMKILAGYQPADSGEILLDGSRATYSNPLTAIRHGIGMLAQDPLDVPAFSVLENFTFGLPLRRGEARAALEQISRRFGFNLDPETPIAALSIAQRQQLEIVRLLALGVKVLILDEPTTGISAEQKDMLFAALKALARDGLTVLLVSHKLEDVIALCDEIIVLRAGRLVGDLQMPATKADLVRLMFGQEIPPQKREKVALGETVLALENASLQAGRLHVENVTLHVRAGEVIGLAGLDGSGQELVLRAMVGLAHLIHGRIMVGGRDFTRQPYRRFLAEGVAFGAAGRLEEGLIAGLTLTEHTALVQDDTARIDWKRARQQTDAQIKRYAVRGRADNAIQQLSGGNQQRVLMGLLPPQPKVLVLEQPTRGLDVDSARWIWETLLERRTGGTAIVFSSPELDEITAYSDRILVFYAGRTYEIPDASRTSIDELGHLIGGEFAGTTAE
ncbi:MAG: ATP-binding cassette domain-containing protein [bacterium]|nr:ATP-binding cassette domain-containing protein [bacterium]